MIPILKKFKSQNAISCETKSCYSDQNNQEDQGPQKIVQFSIKTLQQAKQKLRYFIQSLGDMKNDIISLKKYQQDNRQLYDIQFINSETILIMFDNTVRKMKSNKKIKINWNKDDLCILLWIIEKYNIKYLKDTYSYEQNDWGIISSMIPGKSSQQCMFRFLSLKTNKSNQKIDWTQQEDNKIKNYVLQKNSNWIEISQALYYENNKKYYRNPKQCRERWNCFLDPTLKKSHWTPQEDYILFDKYLQVGKKWSTISKCLYGRTLNAVKNRVQLKIKSYNKDLSIFPQMSLQNYFLKYLCQLESEIKISKKKYSIVSYSETLLPDFEEEYNLDTGRYGSHRFLDINEFIISQCGQLTKKQVVQKMEGQQLRILSLGKCKQEEQFLGNLKQMNRQNYGVEEQFQNEMDLLNDFLNNNQMYGL